MDRDHDLPFQVYCLLSGAKERKLVASFARYIEAEVFIHSELLKCNDFGVCAGRFWGSSGEGGKVYYWIESPQEAPSVRETK